MLGLAALISLAAAPSSAVAEVTDATLDEAEQTLEQGQAAIQDRRFDEAIERFAAGLTTLEAAVEVKTIGELPQALRARYAGLHFLLTRGYIIGHFQAGQARITEGREKLKRAIRLLEQSEQGDPVAVSEAANDFRRAAAYCESTIQLIDHLDKNVPDQFQMLDQNVRFRGPWPGEPADGGPVGFADYYRGGGYVLIAMASVYLGDATAEREWMQKLRSVKQHKELRKTFEEMRAEDASWLDRLYRRDKT
jgi:tetratricopeptide (TPR) repeat protein